MSRLLIACAVLALTACSEEPRYLANRIVKDKNGCAFIVVPNSGDAVFLRFMPDETDRQTCKFRT